ncbi:MAG TPA: BMP family ABC transporter substrate-binding protein, partial [Stellaceae bacterium]|nr:BMP family ABC transporter substrate-binding protein [Stellaceae bacterium]
MALPIITRRRLMQSAAAVAATGPLVGLMPMRSAFAKEVVVGFIYVGSRDDYGYNQAHAQGAAALKGIPGVKVVEEENVAETDACEKTMES